MRSLRRVAVLAPLFALRALAQDPGVGFVAEAPLEGLRTPTDVLLRADGGLVVADSSAGTVTAYRPDRQARWTWSAREGAAPMGIGVDGERVWVAGGDRVVGLDASGRPTAEIALPAGTEASDVAVGPPGTVWVSAAPQDLLVRVDAAGAELARVPDLKGPRGLLADGAGGVWVAEGVGGRVLHVDPSGRVVEAAGGWGLHAGEFVAPRGVARTADGGLVVTDSHQGIAVLLGPDGAFRRTVSGADGALSFVHPLGVDAAGDQIAIVDAGAGKVTVLRGGGPAKDDGQWPADQWLFRPSTVRDADPSTTCRQCHDGTRTLALGIWDPGAHGHPTQPGEHAEIPPSVPVAEDGSLRCTSCHAVHPVDPAESDDPDILRSAELAPVEQGPIRVDCLGCHPSAGAEAGSDDLGHPLGVVPPEGSGLRLTDGRIACQTCHAPHGATFDKLAVRRIDDGTLCLSCHADHGPERSHHPIGEAATADARAFIDQLGGRLGPGDTLTCLSCHDPHGGREKHLLRADGVQSACTGCHEQREGGRHTKEPCAGCHGMHASPTASGAPRDCAACHADQHTLHPTKDEGCPQCHDPHDPRPKPCASCHQENAAKVGGGKHDATVEPVRGARDACGGCHEPHGGGMPYLLDPPVAGVNPAVGRCLACHDGSTRATRIDQWAHPPDKLLVGVGGGTSPYSGPNGEPAAAGQLGTITCRTCHDSHAPAQRNDVVGACAVCHGDQAEGLVRDYHQRARSTP